MIRTISQKICYCLCGDQVIFLDIANDRYFKLPASQNRAFVSSVKGNQQCSEPGSTAILRLLERAEPCRQIATPSHNLQSEAHWGGDPLCVARAALAHASAAIRLKWRGFAEVIHTAENCGRPDLQRARPETYSRLACAFKVLTPIFGRAENCLPRSIAFHRLAVASGRTPALVIGVKCDPFAAHCWVQDGMCVLNDSAEHVRLFTPILVI